MKRRVLVSGADGFLGQSTVWALRSAGWEVVKGVRSPQGGDVSESYVFDLEEPNSILDLASKPPVDAIVHLATKVGWKGETDRDLFIPNVVGTACLLSVARHWDSRFVHASAAIVCGATAEVIRPSSLVNPDTAYGKSKWVAEQMIGASGLDHCILRFGGIYGLNGPEHLGLNRAIRLALQGHPPVIMGSGSARRNYLYVKDAADAILAALDQEITGVHLVSGCEILSIADIMRCLCRVMLPGCMPLTAEAPDAKDQIIISSPEFSNARRFDEAFSDMIAEYRMLAMKDGAVL